MAEPRYAVGRFRSLRTHRMLTIGILTSPDAEADPFVVVGTDRPRVLRMATQVWSAAYPGEVGTVEVFEAPLAWGAVAGRVLASPITPASKEPPVLPVPQRLVGVELVPVQMLPPSIPPPEPVVPVTRGPLAKLACQFVESGAEHARLVRHGGSTNRRQRARYAASLQLKLSRIARLLVLPIQVVTRSGEVYLSRMDLGAEEKGIDA